MTVLRFVVSLVIVCLVLWAGFAFIEAVPNPFNWTSDLRAGYVLFVVCAHAGYLIYWHESGRKSPVWGDCQGAGTHLSSDDTSTLRTMINHYRSIRNNEHFKK